MKISKEDLHSFHRIDRGVFNRLVYGLGYAIPLIMRVMALWLWFEEAGYPSLIIALRDMPNEMMTEFFNEAITILRVLESEVSPFLPSDVAIPKTFNFMGQQLTLDILYEQRSLALQGISETVSSVCTEVFGDDIPDLNTAMVPAFPVLKFLPPPPPPPPTFTEGKIRIPFLASIPHTFRPAWRPVVPFRGFLPIVFEPRPFVPAPFVQTVPWSLMPQNYEMGESSNPLPIPRLAIEPPPGAIRVNSTPVDRTMFVTFSRGFPVSEEELSNYLTKRHGDVVEGIDFADTPPGMQPLWARVVFRSSATVEQILHGEEKVRFVINGRHVWTRRWRQK